MKTKFDLTHLEDKAPSINTNSAVSVVGIVIEKDDYFFIPSIL